MRTFIAVNLPPGLVEGLTRAAEGLGAFKGRLRLVDASGLHITLCFIGEIPSHEAEVLEHGLARIASAESPFVLALGRGGSFPRERDARVVWVGVEGELRRLAGLQTAIARELASLGYRIDRRPFSPHVTLARATRDAGAEDRRDIAAAAAAIDCMNMGAFQVTTVDIMQSFLGPSGATYAPVARIPLGDSAGLSGADR